MIDGKWVETPMYILRRYCVLEITRRWPPGVTVEIGAGTGSLTRCFLDAGYCIACYDLGEETRKQLRERLGHYGEALKVVDSLNQLEKSRYDYLFAFEVLEHIKDDQDVLATWVRLLAPGGRVLLSVPAHRNHYWEEDRSVGHYRRYDRADLINLLISAGLRDIRIYSYGFPLANISRMVKQHLLKRSVRERVMEEPETLSIRSGTERDPEARLLARLLSPRILYPFCAIQKLFWNGDLGEGYIATATID